MKRVKSKAVLKRPLYICVYEEIYQRIARGVYKPGEQLPGENQLASELNVSRGTLRQALLVLQEEGLIINRQGKGNFVSKSDRNYVKNTLLKAGNPVFQLFSGEEELKVTISLVAEPAGEYIRKQLQLDPTTLLVTLHQIYEISDQVVSYGVTLLGYDNFQLYELDLTSQDHLAHFTNKLVYEQCKSTKVKTVITKCDDFLAEKLEVDVDTVLWCWREHLYNNSGEAYAINKYYMIPDYFSLMFGRGR